MADNRDGKAVMYPIFQVRDQKWAIGDVFIMPWDTVYKSLNESRNTLAIGEVVQGPDDNGRWIVRFSQIGTKSVNELHVLSDYHCAMKLEAVRG